MRRFLKGRPGAVLLALLLMASGLGCGGSKQVLDPAYRAKLASRPTLGVLPLAHDLVPAAVAPPASPLNQQGYDLFYRLFPLALREQAILTVFEAGPAFAPDTLAFDVRPLLLAPDDTLALPVPADGPVAIDERFPAFLLLISDLRFFYGTDEGRAALGTLVTSEMEVSAACEYVLWDNQAQRVVGYGRLRQSAPMEAGSNVRGPISLIFQRLASDILRKSPFVRKADLISER